MKRKVRKFDEGGNVRTRTDKEFEEDSKFGGYGRYMPKTKEYTLDEAKDKLSSIFGGGRDESKFSDLESVKKTKTLKEQIGRKDEEEPRRKISDYSTNKGTTSYVSEEDAPYKVEKTTPPKVDKPKKEAAPRKEKAVGEDAKPLPGVSKDKDKPKNLPGKKEKEKEPTPYKDVVKSEDVGSQSFASPKKEPPLRKVGKAIKGTLENANKPFRSSMYDKMKGRKDGGSIKMAKGGSASSRGDGIAQRGKTKGKIY
jgi:hypothetical protein